MVDFQIGERVEGDRGEYGPGKWKCASCLTVRADMDLARMYVGDDYFMLCHGFDDASPTCYEKYQAGRERYVNRAKARRNRLVSVMGKPREGLRDE